MKVKICCIKSIDEAEIAMRAGATAIGLVGPMPSGPGVIDNDEILKIARQVNGRVETFLLTSETSAIAIVDHHRRTLTDTIQLVDDVPRDQLMIIRRALPDVKLVQVIHVINENSLIQALDKISLVDALLLDSGNPGAATKILGGTGNTHNWSISKSIVDQSDIPVYLAGGLKVNNVQDAINVVKPYGIDLCSGVRNKDRLDVAKLIDFMSQVRAFSAD